MFFLFCHLKKKTTKQNKKKRCFNPGKKLLTQGPAFLYWHKVVPSLYVPLGLEVFLQASFIWNQKRTHALPK